MNGEHFKNVASGFKECLFCAAIVVGGIWTLYTFDVFNEVERKRVELEALNRALRERGILTIELIVTPLGDEAGDERDVVVDVRTTNTGNRTELLDMQHSIVRAARVTRDEEGALVLAEPELATFHLVDIETTGQSVMRGQVRTFPYLLRLHRGENYLIQFWIPVSDVEAPLAAQDHAPLPFDESTTFVWMETTYVHVD